MRRQRDGRLRHAAGGRRHRGDWAQPVGCLGRQRQQQADLLVRSASPPGLVRSTLFPLRFWHHVLLISDISNFGVRSYVRDFVTVEEMCPCSTTHKWAFWHSSRFSSHVGEVFVEISQRNVLAIFTICFVLICVFFFFLDI